MITASMIVDIQYTRCGNCKVMIDDDLAIECPICGAAFDRVGSNHVGLAKKLLRTRREAGVEFVVETQPKRETSQPVDAEVEKTAGDEVATASIVVDFQNIRCGHCKVTVGNKLAIDCPTCGATFDRVVSNHIGLAKKLQKTRSTATKNA